MPARIFTFMFLAVALCPAAVRYEQTRAAMGTQFTIVAYGADQSQLETAVNEAFEEVFRLDREWSNYRPESDLSQLNRDAGGEPVRVDRELFRMLQTCIRYSRETDGAFDITVGPLLKLWGFFKGEGRLPKPEELAPVLGRVGWKKILLNERERSVKFAVPGVELDLGGIGKGYAVDRAAEVLREAGVTAALILSGTSSVVAIGAPPGQPGWLMNVRDPKDAKKSAGEIPLKDEALSTSGNYEKFFTAGGRIYSHIFDPRSGYPAEGALSVTVVGPTGTDTDALGTAFFVLGRDRTARYLREHPGLRVFFCSETGCEWIK